MIQNDTLPTVLVDVDGGLPLQSDDEPSVRRRRLLESLESHSGVATLDQLVEAVVSADGTPADRRRLRVRFHHVDLPRLEDAGALRYDSDRHRVHLVDDSSP